MFQFEQAFIHEPEPERRKIREQIDAKIATRQLRQILKMSQRLVPPEGVGVVIRMPLEMKQNEIGEYVIAVPRVMRFAAFVLTVFALEAQQAVVLYIVGARKLPVGK